jgi:hypothetical protein
MYREHTAQGEKECVRIYVLVILGGLRERQCMAVPKSGNLKVTGEPRDILHTKDFMGYGPLPILYISVQRHLLYKNMFLLGDV